VITGSFNWSPSAAHTNDETLLVIHSPQLAQHFTREMDRLWDTAELGITPHIQRKLDRQRSDVAMGWRGVKQIDKNYSSISTTCF
jgi:phosphatidylserine/phosphatidylglycerophosphate/cardiolipin synthase-like enzyme